MSLFSPHARFPEMNFSPALACFARLFSGLCSLLREKRCFACATPVEDAAESQLCASCSRRLLPRTSGYCPRCGSLSAWEALPPAVCGACLADPPPWDFFYQYAAYEDLLRDLLLRLKFRGELALAHHLGGLLLQGGFTATVPPGTALVPIPLHPQRLRVRGFNQARELARRLTGENARLDDTLLARVTHGKNQAELHFDERRRNIKGAFAASAKAAGKNILLVDDVFTTGATMREAAHALLAAGAVSVGAVVVARTPAYSITGYWAPR